MNSTVLLTFAFQFAFIALLVLGLRWFFLKALDRTNGVSPRLPGESKWPAIPQANILQAKYEVFRGPLFWISYMAPLIILTVLYQMTAIGQATGFAGSATRVLIVLIALYVGRMALAAAVRKRLNIN